jgi:hypothetical protein
VGQHRLDLATGRRLKFAHIRDGAYQEAIKDPVAAPEGARALQNRPERPKASYYKAVLPGAAAAGRHRGPARAASGAQWRSPGILIGVGSTCLRPDQRLPRLRLFLRPAQPDGQPSRKRRRPLPVAGLLRFVLTRS